MRSNLKRGLLVPPSTLTEALERHKQLVNEIPKVERQLADPTRPLNFLSIAEYDAWKAAAGRALSGFKKELALLSAWIREQEGSVMQLLQSAYDILKGLELEVDFEKHEQEVMRRLDVFFEAAEKKVGNVG